MSISAIMAARYNCTQPRFQMAQPADFPYFSLLQVESGVIEASLSLSKRLSGALLFHLVRSESARNPADALKPGW